MSVRLVLQFTETPSHALITCEPWTRWLTETESPSDEGHVVGNEIALRKATNELNIITRIKIYQLKGDTTKAQRYLDAAAWWLHRTPFGVERLPVKLTAHQYQGSLVNIGGAKVTSMDLMRGEEGAPISLESLGSLPANFKELNLCGIHVSDLSPLLRTRNWCDHDHWSRYVRQAEESALSLVHCTPRSLSTCRCTIACGRERTRQQRRQHHWARYLPEVDNAELEEHATWRLHSARTAPPST